MHVEPAHSKFSASGFEAAMLCPGKPAMEDGKPDNSNIYSATGTVAHTLLERALRDNESPAGFLGRVFQEAGFDIEVDDDMVAAVETALRNVHEMAGDGLVLSEQRVNYSRYLGVEEAQGWGTADVIVVRGSELQVHDYKNGSGVVVHADNNPQMMLYALGALEAVNDTLGPFKTARLVIHQPHIKDTPSEWATPVADLEHWALTVAGDAVDKRKAAATALELGDFLVPGVKQCKFCKAKATCPALRAEVAGAVGLESDAASPDEFAGAPVLSPTAESDADWLAASLGKADMIEDWVKAIRAEVDRRLLAGESVPGYKVVQGKLGNRKWADAAEAEKVLKSMRLKTEEMYDFKLISPTTAEKLHKAKTIGPRQWPTLKTMITQTQGKPHVAPETDPRPALTLTPVADDFDSVDSLA